MTEFKSIQLMSELNSVDLLRSGIPTYKLKIMRAWSTTLPYYLKKFCYNSKFKIPVLKLKTVNKWFFGMSLVTNLLLELGVTRYYRSYIDYHFAILNISHRGKKLRII